MTGDDLSQALKAVDTLGVEIEDYVDGWMTDNEARWKGWMNAAMEQ